MKKITVLFLTLFFALLFTTCKKVAEKTPVDSPTTAKNYSVPELKALATCTNSCDKRFTSEASFVGVVVADEITGNFYKEIYVRDRYNTGGIRIDFLFSKCNFFVGDSVRLNLKGYDVNINSQTGMMEIDSVDYDKHMVRFASGANPAPRIADLAQLPYSSYYCDLVTINNVKFLSTDTGRIYADPILQQSLNRTLQDCGNNQIIVRTSNFADFAQQKTPSGFGSITGIATAYSGANQMAIRKTADVKMNGTGGCVVYAFKDFNDASLTSGGWIQQSVLNPSVLWVASSFGSAKFAKISGFVSGNQNSENWLISPSLNIANGSNPILSFITAANFSGTPLEVWVSTDYVSGLPGTGTWTQLTGFALSPQGGYVWTNSGIISLNAYKSANTRIAFKYKSTTTGSTTYEVDDINIREN